MYLHPDNSYRHFRPCPRVFFRKFFFLLFLLILTAGTASARQRFLSGNLTIGLDSYNRKTDNSGQTSQHQTKINIAPGMIISSKSGRNFLEADITPIFTYDFTNDQFDMDHTLSLQGYHYFTRRWQIGFAERSVRSDDATLLADTRAPLTEEYGRRRYWSNQLDLYTEHVYGKKRNWRINYLSDVLRNDDTGPGGYEDFDRHDLGLELNHAFNSRWSLSLNGHYVRGLYYPPDNRASLNDVTEHRASITLTYSTRATRSHYISYNYSDSIYDIPRNNLYLHEVTFGGHNRITQRSTFSYGIGFSREITTEDQGGNGYLKYSRRFRRSTIQAGFEQGYNLQNFNRTGEQGLVAYRLLSASATHSFTQKLTGDISLSWRNEDRGGALILDPYDNINYTAGIGVSYTFLSRYTARLRYSYSGQQSELYDDYEEHRIFCSISAHTDKLQW